MREIGGRFERESEAREGRGAGLGGGRVEGVNDNSAVYFAVFFNIPVSCTCVPRDWRWTGVYDGRL